MTGSSPSVQSPPTILGKDKAIIKACLAGLIAFYIYHCLYWYSQAIDDAFITFRYAKNLCNGLGIVFNPGERIEGYSNFSWLLLIALGIKLGFAPIIAARFFGVLSGIGSIICSYFLFKQLSPAPRSSSSLLPPLLLATNTFFCFWSFTGMESSFFSFIMILAVLLYFKEAGRAFPFSAFFFGVLSLSRPEGLGYLGVFLAVEAFLRFQDKRSSDQSDQHGKRYTWLFCGIIFLILSGYLIFKLVYYGSILPNPYYSKTKLPFQNLNINYLVNFFFHHSAGLFLMLIVSLVAGIRFLGKKIWFLVSLLLFNYFFIIYGTDWMPNYRFFVHTLPIFFTLIALGLQESIRQIRRLTTQYSGAATLTVVLLLGHHIWINVIIDQETCYNMRFAHTEKPDGWLDMVPDIIQNGIWPDLIRETMFLIENTDENMTVGLRDIGFPSFITNCRIYDQEILVNKGARECHAVFKSNNDIAIKNYIFGEMRQNLADYRPDFYLFPGSVSSFWGKWVGVLDRMYESFLNTQMDPIARFNYGKEFIVYYRRKRLDRQRSVGEIIQKYEDIVRKYPSYPAFTNRLNELYKHVGRLPELVVK